MTVAGTGRPSKESRCPSAQKRSNTTGKIGRTSSFQPGQQLQGDAGNEQQDPPIPVPQPPRHPFKAYQEHTAKTRFRAQSWNTTGIGQPGTKSV